MTDDAAKAVDIERWIDARSDAFETAILDEASPMIEEFLADAPSEIRCRLRRELIGIELEVRFGRNDQPTVDEYQLRFPDMTRFELQALLELASQHAEMGRAARVRASSSLTPTVVLPRSAAGPARPDGPAPADSSAAGRVVRYCGDYELLREIARGGMGIVFEARQRSLNRIVALKMIRSGSLASTEEVARFRREAEAAAQLEHPGIVPIFEVGQDGDAHYFSMGFVAGLNLSQRLLQSPLAPRDAAQLVCDVALAVQYAHERGVVHRDLKPSNILLQGFGVRGSGLEKAVVSSVSPPTPDPQPLISKVTDFGLARVTHAEHSLTETGQIIGTPSYMPPEQAAGLVNQVGPASDIYSLGAVLYACLTGRPPFQSASAVDTVRQVLEREPVSLRELNVAVPVDLETICLKCLEKSIPRRYATARDLADELQRYLDERPILSRPVSRLERALRWCRRNRLVALLTAGLALSLIVGTVVSVLFAMGEHDASLESKKQAGIARDRERDAYQSQQVAEQAEQKTRETLLTTQSQREQAMRELARARQQLYVADIQHAASALKRGDVAAVLRYLERQQPGADGTDLREWEWYYLRSVCFGFDATWRAHEAPVDCVAWSPTGDRFAAADTSGTISIWTGDAEQPQFQFRTESRQLLRLTWDASGKWLAASPRSAGTVPANRHQLCHVFEAATGTLKLTRSSVDVAWHSNRATLAGAESGGGLWIWNAGDAAPVSVPGFDKTARSLCWIPDSDRLAVGLANSVELLDSATGEIQLKLSNNTGRDDATASSTGKANAVGSANSVASVRGVPEFICLAASADGRHLAGVVTVTEQRPGLPAAPRSELIVWHPVTGEDINRWPLRSKPSRLKWHADGERLLVCPDVAMSPVVALHHVAKAEPLLTVEGWDADWHSRRDQFAVCDHTSLQLFDAQIWNLTTPRVLRGHVGEVYSVAWHPRDDSLITGSGDLTIRRWQSRQTRPPGWPAGTSVVSTSPDERWVIIRRDEQGIARTEFLKADSGASMFGVDHEIAPQVTWSSDSRRAVLTTHGQIGPGPKRILSSIAVWDVSSGRTLWLQQENPVRAFAWSPNGDELLIARNQPAGVAQVFTADGRTVSGEWPLNGSVWGIAWSPTGNFWACALAVPDPNGGVAIPKLELHDFEGRLIQRFGFPAGVEARMLNPAFSPDGHSLAWSVFDAGTQQRRLFVWNTESRELTAELTGQDEIIAQLVWNRAGTRLAAGGLRTTKLHDVSQHLELLELNGPAGHGLHWSGSGWRLGGQQQHWDASAGFEHAAPLPAETFEKHFRPVGNPGFF